VTDFEDEEGVFLVARHPLNLQAAQPLPDDRTPVLVANRLGCDVEEPRLSVGEIEVDEKTGDVRVTTCRARSC
jgi:hypothetical protein